MPRTFCVPTAQIDASAKGVAVRVTAARSYNRPFVILAKDARKRGWNYAYIAAVWNMDGMRNRFGRRWTELQIWRLLNQYK